MVPCLVTLTDL